ncbi:response regulator transcription factor [Phycicoccus endophyticus]|uniref:Response regulator transcription factor n=1 Tax=Phycicoccus endophyticus TaxID=1690220 RepID=A0A7G9QZZ5_9MICO|nr:response regulator transcription factor [Phycicoccus endophyticus]NHI20779.1 response regulator transcription factor [Phycicoccus endophyticus]QNN48920.1 response regulator transcription factor [Phycicoccus endophyticus]
MAKHARPVRVALVNDYDIVVQGLARMFEPFRDRVHLVEFDSRMPVERRVDVLLYDTFAQDQADRASIAEILAAGEADRIVLYSWNTHESLARTALERGAAGYLSKGMTAEQLVAALERVHAGEQVTDRTDSTEDASGDWPGRAEGLTAREAEILALITQGLRNEDIARRTYLSINSVKSYIRSAYRKIGVQRRSQAVLWGVRHGFEPDTLRRRGPDAED